MTCFAEDLDVDADFIFQNVLASALTGRITRTFSDAHAITVLNWPMRWTLTPFRRGAQDYKTKRS